MDPTNVDPALENSLEQDPDLRREVEDRILARMKALSKYGQEIAETLPFELLHTLVSSGQFSVTDMRFLLRAQGLRCEFNSPICDPTHDTLQRSARQLHVLPPDKPTIQARNLLLCPFHERHVNGDPYVPCHDLFSYGADPMRDAFDEEWKAPRNPQEYAVQVAVRRLMDQKCTPCEWVGKVAERLLYNVAERAAAKDLPPLVQHAQDLLARSPGPMTGAEARSQLTFLFRTRPLGTQELVAMFENHLPVTDLEWLPCQDKKRRVQYVPRTSADDILYSETDYEPMELRCHLQVRGKQGDRTVPCVQALAERPHPTFIAAEALFRKRGLVPGGPAPSPLIDEEEKPLPVSWTGEDDQPGGPRDPVRVLQMRPCYLLGRMYHDDLATLMEVCAEGGPVPAQVLAEHPDLIDQAGTGIRTGRDDAPGPDAATLGKTAR